MTIDENMQMLEKLKIVENNLMKQFAYNLFETTNHEEKSAYAVSTFRKILKVQGIIDDIERRVSVERGDGFFGKFGKIVYSKEDLDFYDQLFDIVSPKKENVPTKKI